MMKFPKNLNMYPWFKLITQLQTLCKKHPSQLSFNSTNVSSPYNHVLSLRVFLPKSATVLIASIFLDGTSYISKPVPEKLQKIYPVIHKIVKSFKQYKNAPQSLKHNDLLFLEREQFRTENSIYGEQKNLRTKMDIEFDTFLNKIATNYGKYEANEFRIKASKQFDKLFKD